MKHSRYQCWYQVIETGLMVLQNIYSRGLVDTYNTFCIFTSDPISNPPLLIYNGSLTGWDGFVDDYDKELKSVYEIRCYDLVSNY